MEVEDPENEDPNHWFDTFNSKNKVTRRYIYLHHF